jgi:methoxymalonate biosynthesis acyl carrier protein
MTTEHVAAPIAAEIIEDEILRFIGEQVKATAQPDQDLFKSGLVSSMFAMQLVVHLEETYDIAVVGPDLKLDNFRTAQAMTGLVLRLRDASSTARDV